MGKRSGDAEYRADPGEQLVVLSIRLPADGYWALQCWSGLQHRSVADQAREFLLGQMAAALDPAEIARQMDSERDRVLEWSASAQRELAGGAER